MTQGSHNFVTNDRCVEMETVLFSLPAIIALPAIVAFRPGNEIIPFDSVIQNETKSFELRIFKES